MLALPFFLISLTALIIATYTDLKERIVPDKLTYSLIGGGLLLQLGAAVLFNSLQHFFTVLIVTLGAFLGSYLLWKIGVWAGGDVKLFTALSVLNPVNYGVIRDSIGLNDPIFVSIALPIFPLTLFVFSIFSMIPLAILITIKGIIKNAPLQKKIFADLKAKAVSITISALLISGALFFFSLINLNFLFALPLLLLIGFFGKKVSAVIGAVVFLAAVFLGGVSLLEQFFLLFFSLFLLYFFIKLYLIAKSEVLVEKIRIKDLKDGMISAELIVKEKEEVKVCTALSMKTVINHIRNNNVDELIKLMQPKGKILATPANAGGVSEEQIEELKKAAENKEIKDYLLVKKSVPFVPAVLLAYLFAQTIGDIIWQVIF